MRRFIERCLLLAGVVMLGVWAWSEVRYALWQDWGNWVFDRKLHHQSTTTADYLTEKADYLIEKKDQLYAQLRARLGLPAIPTRSPSSNDNPSFDRPSPVAPQPSIEHNALIGRLTIPRLHLSAAVREGAEEDTLALALGHIPATALPGQKGNVGIAGHRDKLFRGLREIRPNDRIEFETLAGKYVYEVGSLQIVKPSNVAVLKAGNSPELTLVTCYPFNYIGSAPDRFIVKARQLTSNLPAEEPSKTQTVSTTQSVSAVRLASKPDRPDGSGRIGFNVPKDHSRQLAPGIWFGVTDTDAASHVVNGWMWIMPDRRTIWLRNRSTDEPVIFYSMRDGKRRELRLTSIMENSAAGYLSSSE
jgi:sortase A